jgi:hypothetical protein
MIFFFGHSRSPVLKNTGLFCGRPRLAADKVKVEVRWIQTLHFRLEANQIDVGHVPCN